MIIQRLRCYFLYNIPITNHLPLDHENNAGLCIDQAMIDKFRPHFAVMSAPTPAFYTAHYRTHHTPYTIHSSAIPNASYIPKERLAEIPFFAELHLTQDITVTWELTLSLNSIGLVTLCLHVDEPLPATLAYRLDGLYLNPEYAVIATAPLQAMWSQAPETRPEFVTPDDLARAIHISFFSACNLEVYRYRALRHEIQIPFMAVEVQTEYATQPEFIEKEAYELAELVFRPACWEVGRSSRIHARHVLDDARVWSVSKDVLVFASYEGCVYVKIKNYEVPPLHEVSSFHLTSEASVLHSFKVAASGYHLLRILDDLLDHGMENLVERVHQGQHGLKTNPDNQAILQELDDLAIHITYLRFQLLDLLEEISNADKLIDEEYHIVLLDQLNAALGTKAWFDGMNRRIISLRELVQTIESTYERLAGLNTSRQIEHFNAEMLQITLDNQKLDERLSKAQPFFEALAAVEALNLMIYIWFDPSFPILNAFQQNLGWKVGIPSRLIATLMVAAALFLIIEMIHWIAGRWAEKKGL